jgi:phosphohistidine phosphatase SixA
MNLLYVVILTLTFSFTSCRPASDATTDTTAEVPESVFLLVRHAEKVDESDDPPLSDVGHQRAQTLASLLRDARIERIYSSDLVRTRDTAAPLIEDLGIELSLYDPGNVSELAKELLLVPGRYLIVGHGNTTPELAQLLGGEPGSGIAPNEYDRLYVLVHRPGLGTTTTLLRF